MVKLLVRISVRLLVALGKALCHGLRERPDCCWEKRNGGGGCEEEGAEEGRGAAKKEKRERRKRTKTVETGEAKSINGEDNNEEKT